jgi:tRNA(Ile)-lysidine synthase
VPLSVFDPGLTRRVAARLDARLCRDVEAPLAVAFSGGGDSLALLALAAEWARANGRRVLALTVDHGLNPDAADWSRRSQIQARALGADWAGLRWTGPKPSTGLPAVARAARHALLADAARAAGSAVILFGHTADDVAESDLIRAEGTPIGRLRDWSPSPAWPQGRGLMLLRPLLEERREALRTYLRTCGLGWIEDPANDDPRFARARARSRCPSPVLVRVEATPCGAEWSSDEGGVVALPRAVGARTLSAALTSAGGGSRAPRGDRLMRLSDRLVSGEDFDAVLCGARLSAQGARVLVHREPGEQRRGGLARLDLRSGVASVWDGRYEIEVDAPGCFVVPAHGLLNRLSSEDRAALSRLPSAARGAAPVLIRDDDPRPVLARRAGRARSLVEARLAAALDATSHEADLIRPRMAPGRPCAYFDFDEAAALSATA